MFVPDLREKKVESFLVQKIECLRGNQQHLLASISFSLSLADLFDSSWNGIDSSAVPFSSFFPPPRVVYSDVNFWAERIGKKGGKKIRSPSCI